MKIRVIYITVIFIYISSYLKSYQVNWQKFQTQLINLKSIQPQGSVVRAVDRQSKGLGSNPSAVESVFFSQKDFKFFKFE